MKYADAWPELRDWLTKEMEYAKTEAAKLRPNSDEPGSRVYFVFKTRATMLNLTLLYMDELEETFE